MRRTVLTRLAAAVFSLAVLLTASSKSFGAATIVILNNDQPNVGFNDPAPITPVGNNTGTTLGQQRLNAFQFAANIWGAILNSNVTITIQASWTPMTCSPTSGVLGRAGAAGIFRDFPNAPNMNTWYSASLANALAGSDLSSNPEINAQFNSSVGNAGCLDSGGQSHFYLGLDNNHGTDIDLVSVLIHEFSHGFGFQTFTNISTGAQSGSTQGGFFPSIYDKFLFDDSAKKTWDSMTDAERVSSATNNGNLTWNGSLVTGLVHSVLGTPRLRINSPAGVAGNYTVGTAAFGAALSPSGVTANVALSAPNDGCTALTNGGTISGRVALIDRGNCTFVTKVKNAQNAGAVGTIIADNITETPINMGGSDSTINITSVLISLADGNTIKAQSNVNGTLLIDTSVAAGADAAGRALMYAPTTLVTGSSVSHWDSSTFPNQLMEPAISGDLTHSVAQPFDLTLAQLRDVGWSANPIGDVPFYVRQHYLDFLNRQPDSSGLNFWMNDIFNCGIDQQCVEVHRINVSVSFFLSTEFQQTGYLVERFYKVAYGDKDGASGLGGGHTLKVPSVRFREDFLPDTAAIGNGVQVGVGNWQAQLETNKQNYALAFVQRSSFTQAYSTTLTPAQFVDQLFSKAGLTPSTADRNAAIAEFGTGAGDTSNVAARGRAVRDVAENSTLAANEFNKAFVLMQYFGYLQRNPSDAPDLTRDYTGYEFWLNKLNQFNGNYINAEMVKAFITSTEYRARFGNP